MKNGAVIYCRVSTDEQVEKYSLDVQREECKKKAEELGVEVLEEFIEEGVSGAIQERPEMMRMMQFCTEKKGEVQYIIVKAIDRFSRDVTVYWNLKRFFQTLGIKLYSINEPTTIEETPESDFLENIFSGVSQLERAISSPSTSNTLQSSASLDSLF